MKRGLAIPLAERHGATDRPVLEGAAIPVLTPNRCTRIPDAWLQREAVVSSSAA